MIKHLITKERLPLVIIICFSIIFSISFYGKIIISPNDYMFGQKGDGIKNYYTYAYQIKNNKSYSNFEGMNYPYGDNYLFTDCQPIIANSFKFLSPAIPFLIPNSIGIINFLMIASITLTFIIVFLLFRELKQNQWLSILFSITITVLAPQLFRIGGHHALSYSIAIPLSWLLLLKSMKSNKLPPILLLFFNNLIWLFIHAYLGVIILSFLISFTAIAALSDKKTKRNIVKYSLVGLSVIIPLFLFFIYSKATDTHTDRTTNPFGFFLFNAELDDIFLPHSGPLYPIIYKLSGGTLQLNYEAWGYVGIANTVFFIVMVFVSIASIFSKKHRTTLKGFFENKYISISLGAATIPLIFALGIPFKQSPDLLELIPFLKQFRATGRFVWPFYFAFTVFAAYNFNKFAIKKYNQNKALSIIIISAITCSLFIEGLADHRTVSAGITKESNLFKKSLLSDNLNSAIDNINTPEYQAIISIPFFHIGSENFTRPYTDNTLINSFTASYYTGIPMVCANLARTSITESKKIIQLVTPNYYEKEIEHDIKSELPFLIIKSNDAISEYENIILSKATTVYKNNDIELLSINKSALFSDDRQLVIDSYNNKKDSLIRKGEFRLSAEPSAFIYLDFDKNTSDTTYRGKGSFKAVKKDKNTITAFSPNTFNSDTEYKLSLWMHNGEADALNLHFQLLVEEFDMINNQVYNTLVFPEKAETIHYNWSLVEMTFKVKDSKNLISIVTKGKKNSKAKLYADDLLITDQGIDVYKENNGSLFFNNHKIAY